MTLRTFTIHPADDAPVLQLRCDVIDFSDACVALGTGNIRILGELSNSSNGALLGEIESNVGTISVVIKPSMYENPLYDFEWGTLSKREVASYELSQLLGWKLVPPTVLRDVEDMEASVQLFIPHDPREHYFTLSSDHRDVMEQFAVFDYIVNNADRKSGHILGEVADSFDLYIDKKDETATLAAHKKLWGIDHGLTFHTQDKLRTVIWEFSEENISENLVSDIAATLPHIEERMRPLLSAHEIEKTIERVEKILINPFHRALVAHSQAFPWPLV